MGLLGWVGGLGGGGGAKQSDRMAGNDGDPASQIDLVKARVHKQAASHYLNDLAEKITRKCFDKCYVAGKANIDTDEAACTALCCDRYLDTFNEKVQQSRAASHCHKLKKSYSP